MKAYEVYVIGGGPAGSATALSVINHLNEREKEKVVVRQICGPTATRDAIGETIPPVATEYLRKLGVADMANSTDHLPCPGSTSVWGNDEPGFNDFFFTPVGQGYHLDRHVFNADFLLNAQNQGVNLMENSKLLGIETSENGFSLKIECNGTMVRKHADFVVDATGIQAKVARSLGVVRNQYDAVISACHIYELSSKPTRTAHTLVSAVENGWWYGTQLPNNKALISFCTDKETLKEHTLTNPTIWHQSLIDSGWFYRNCCQQFGAELIEPDNIDTRVAPSAILSCVIGGNWLAVGDAASGYDSMTSAGITKALQQGLEAGQAIVQLYREQNHDALKKYQQSVFSAFNEYLKLHQDTYHSEQRFPESEFWQRRQFK